MHAAAARAHAADCAVSLVTPDASPSACAGDASVSASFRFSGRHVQGATMFTATLGGNVCTLPAGEDVLAPACHAFVHLCCTRRCILK